MNIQVWMVTTEWQFWPCPCAYHGKLQLATAPTIRNNLPRRRTFNFLEKWERKKTRKSKRSSNTQKVSYYAARTSATIWETFINSSSRKFLPTNCTQQGASSTSSGVSGYWEFIVSFNCTFETPGSVSILTRWSVLHMPNECCISSLICFPEWHDASRVLRGMSDGSSRNVS